MSRLIWFTLGAMAGMVYASRLIEQEHLDLPGALITKTPEHQGEKADGRTKLATTIEQRSAMIGDMIQARGRMLADKLRSSKEQVGHREPTTSPFGEPAMMDTRQAAAVGSRYEPDLGLEANR